MADRADAIADAAAVAGMLRAGLAPREAFAAAGWGEPGEDGAPPGAPPEFAVAARLAHATGCALAPVLDACAAAAKDDAEAELAREAALAGPQLSARVLAWLPAVGLGFGVLVDPGMVRVFATPVGAGLLAIGAALAAGGRWWMRRLVLRASPAAHPLGVALHAVRAAMGAGADVASAIAAVGNAMAPEPTLASAAARMSTAATALARGEEWAAVWSGAELDPLERALRLPWERGAQAAPLLTAVATGEALRRRRAAQVAAAELGVRLTLPLALCLLPAFVVVGIAPLVLSVVRAVF